MKRIGDITVYGKQTEGARERMRKEEALYWKLETGNLDEKQDKS